MKFKDLPVGAVFEFERKPEFHLVEGPWVKLSPRKYCLRLNACRTTDGRVVCMCVYQHTVGTVNTEVVAQADEGLFPTPAEFLRRGL